MEAFEALNSYYSNYDEESRLTLQHGRVEFTVTVSFIEKYLTSGMKILEIGAASGRYSHYFARLGYEVDAVELIPANIEKFRANTSEGENVRIFQGNAVDLSDFGDDEYDIVLLLGPMYHLFTVDEQQKAMSEAKRVLKSGGVMFTAYCMNDPTIVNFCFVNGNIWYALEQNMVDREKFKCHSTPKDLFVLWRRDEIFELTKSLDMERLHFVGTDMYTNYIRETVDAMDKRTFDMWLKYCFSICEREDLVGLSHHTLDILRKR